MYSINKQSGRSRVCKMKDNSHKKSKKKIEKKTPYFKLVSLQGELFKEGYDYHEYEKYIQEKINDDRFYYKLISNDDHQKLLQRFQRLIDKENNKYNEIDDQHNVREKQRRLFRKKRREIIDIKKRDLIESFFKEMKRSGKLVRLNENSSYYDPDSWNHTKKSVFGGNTYLEENDKGWLSIYRKLESCNEAHLFDLHDIHDFNEFIYNYNL
jgi:hypothetical protein